MVTIVFPCCTYVSSVMMSSWHFSTSGFNIRFPKTPQNENKNLKKNSSDYFHILHIVEFWCDFKMFVGPWSIYIYIKCLWVMLTNVYWFRATGGYICGCGRPSNLVVIKYCMATKALVVNQTFIVLIELSSKITLLDIFDIYRSRWKWERYNVCVRHRRLQWHEDWHDLASCEEMCESRACTICYVCDYQ